MHSSITFTHPDDPTLMLTIGRPTEEAWGDAWNTISQARSKEAGTMAAGYNLIIACSKSVSRAELPTLIDDWPMVTALALGSGAELAGTLTLASKADPESVNAWRFDLAATVAAGKEIAELRMVRATSAEAGEAVVVDANAGTVNARLNALLEEHTPTLEALAASGLTLESAADIAARYNRKGQLLCLRTKDHGIIIAKRPGFQSSMGYANGSTEDGAYSAARALVLASVVYPVNGAIGAHLTEFPALTTSLVSLVQSMVQGGLGAVVKKE